MLIREYMSADFESLRQMHAAQGFGYPLPDLDSPLFLAKLVLEDEAPQHAVANAGHRSQECSSSRESSSQENRSQETATIQSREAAHRDSPPDSSNAASPGRVVMAVLLRLTAETYLLHDPKAGTPQQRWQHFLALHDAARTSAAARGLDDVQAFLPPRVARSFGRRLARLGWAHDPWTCFSRRV